MVDYQVYQTLASILQAIFTAIIAFLTIGLVYLTHQYSKATKQYADATDKYVETTQRILGETANYAETTEEMFKASIIDRQIGFYEKRLEKLYMPIYNNRKLFEYLPNAFNEFEAMGVNNFVIEIKPYSYLANDQLRASLERLLNECGTLFSNEAEEKRRSEEYIKLKENILKQVEDGIKNDKLLLKGMIEEHQIKIRKSILTGRYDIKIK